MLIYTTAGIIRSRESKYSLHPASPDGTIQLELIACYRGRPAEANRAFVPVQVFHRNDIAGDACTVVARRERLGIRGAHLDSQMLGLNGEVLLSVTSLRCLSYSNEAKSLDKTFSSPFTRLA